VNVWLSASMSCANALSYSDVMTELERAGIDGYHFDFCDGHFAPTFLLWPGLVRDLRPLTTKRFDVHLYCTHPSRYLDELARAGADLVVVHLEASEDYRDVVRRIRDRGLRAGLAILPGSTVPDELQEVLPQLNLVIANTVGPAYAGQPFDPRGVANAARVRAMAQNLDLEIAADGNVGPARLPVMLSAGCSHLICGTSSIFKPGHRLDEALAGFRAEVTQAAAALAGPAS
jgi:ribulose-phosphate 3-epimerase